MSDNEIIPNEHKLKFVKKVVTCVAVLVCLFHLYTGAFGSLSTMNQRAIHWLLMSVLIFLMYPSKNSKFYILDFLLMILAAVSGLYIIFSWESIALSGAGAQTTLDLAIGCVGVLIAIEAARRTLGWVLPITAGIFLLYLLIGPWLPEAIHHSGYSLRRVITLLFFSTDGLYGTPIGVSATFIIMFVIFGAMLNRSGGGKFFIDFAFAIAGRFRGGSAKTAILSSALMGSVSGSPIANVVTTGIFTIPLMKTAGYRADVAGAVEAVSSTGGQIMPPIMGAAAFLMAEFTGLPYAEIAWAALIPALLYYLAIYVVVDIEAIKQGILGQKKEELPGIWDSIKQGWFMLTPLIPLVYLIMSGYSPTKSVFWTIVILVVVYLIANRKLRGFISFLIEGFEAGVKNCASVAAACACAGIVVGVIQLTGLGLRLTSLISVISGDSILIALIFTAIASLILGMGLPTTVLYIVLASLAAPALIKMGVPVLLAHLFVFYYGCISTITPPVALTSYAAAGVAHADPTRIGINAFKFGFAAYVIPFMMIYGPALVLMGEPSDIALAVVTASIGVYSLASCMTNYLIMPLGIILRIPLFVAALCLIKPGIYTDLIGLSCFAGVLLIQLYRKKGKGQGTRVNQVKAT